MGPGVGALDALAVEPLDKDIKSPEDMLAKERKIDGIVGNMMERNFRSLQRFLKQWLVRFFFILARYPSGSVFQALAKVELKIYYLDVGDVEETFAEIYRRHKKVKRTSRIERRKWVVLRSTISATCVRPWKVNSKRFAIRIQLRNFSKPTKTNMFRRTLPRCTRPRKLETGHP